MNFKRNKANKAEKENKVVNEIDVLINEENNLDLQLKELQRRRDLEVDSIDTKYSNEIDKILRKKDFINEQMKQARIYANKHLGGK